MSYLELIQKKMAELSDPDVHTAIEHVSSEHGISEEDLLEAYDAA